MAAPVVGTAGVFYKTNAPEGFLPALAIKGWVKRSTVTTLTTNPFSSVIQTASASTAHGFLNGNVVQLTGIGNTGGLALSTNYYVQNATLSTFQVSASVASPVIQFTGAGDAAVSAVPQLVNINATNAAGVLTTADNTALLSLDAADLLVLGIQPVKLIYVLRDTGSYTTGASNVLAIAAAKTGTWTLPN
jgi:hypothetical protein